MSDRTSKEKVGFEVDGVEAYRLEGGAIEISEPVEDGYILIPASVADSFCKWIASLQGEPIPAAQELVTFLTAWEHIGNLQTYESRNKFRKEARFWIQRLSATPEPPAGIDELYLMERNPWVP